MPSNKPRLMTYTDQETIDKFEIIAKAESRSMSKQLEYIVKSYIQGYEKQNGVIKQVNIGRDNNGNITL